MKPKNVNGALVKGVAGFVIGAAAASYGVRVIYRKVGGGAATRLGAGLLLGGASWAALRAVTGPGPVINAMPWGIATTYLLAASGD